MRKSLVSEIWEFHLKISLNYNAISRAIFHVSHLAMCSCNACLPRFAYRGKVVYYKSVFFLAGVVTIEHLCVRMRPRCGLYLNDLINVSRLQITGLLLVIGIGIVMGVAMGAIMLLAIIVCLRR